LLGRRVQDLSVPGEVSVVAITRDAQAILPTLGTEFRRGDVIHLAVLSAALERLKALLD
jgi:trk system potassium uptake protein TrkA